MSSNLQLSVFGTIHMDSPGKVTRELRAVADGADALFVEYPERQMTVRELVGAALRGPLTAIGLLLLFQLVQGPLFVLFNRDLFPTEIVALQRVASDMDVPVHSIDDGFWNILTDVGPVGILANWLVLGVLGVIWPVPVAVTTALFLCALGALVVRALDRRLLALAVFGGWYVLAGALTLAGYLSVPLVLVASGAFLVFVHTTLGSRNRSMLDRIADLSAEHGYEHATFVTGKAHLSDIARRGADRDLELGDIHVSLWRRDGLTLRGPDPEVLPDARNLSLDLDVPDRGPIQPGSEGSVLRRWVRAGLVDLAWTFCISVLVAGTTIGLVVALGGSVPESLVATVFGLAVLVWPLVDVLFRTLSELKYDTTVGKRVAGLAVADADDYGEPSTGSYVLRGLVRVFDGVGFYLVGAFFAAATDRGQRLGDVVAGTVVGRRVDPLERLAEAPVVIDTAPAPADGWPTAEAAPAADAGDQPGGASEPGTDAADSGDREPTREEPDGATARPGDRR